MQPVVSGNTCDQLIAVHVGVSSYVQQYHKLLVILNENELTVLLNYYVCG